jgi:Ca2+-binding RTX toxin-like protein
MFILGTVEGETITGNLLDELGYSSSLYNTGAGLFTTMQGGTLDIQSNGDFTYTPPSSFSGADNFSYEVYQTSSAMIQEIQNAQVNVLPDVSSQNTAAAGSVGNDIFLSSLAFNAYDGGAGIDTISFASATQAVTVENARVLNDGFGGRDSLVNIENITGSMFGDVIIASDVNNVIDGGAGNNKLYGMVGDDVIYGGADNDIIYGDAKREGANDGADTIYAGAGKDIVYAGGGDDLIYMDAGADKIYGGSGIDTISYANQTSKIIANINTQDGTDATGARDTLSSIENVIGSDFADTITGSRDDNVIEGGAGDDKIFGHLGNDIINSGDGDDFVYGDLKVQSNEDGADTINAGAGDDTVLGQGGADIIDGGADNDRLIGGGGDDVVYGGAGNDLIYGDSEANQSTDGDDTVYGGDGDDSLFGSAGDDTLNGEAGRDRLFGGDGDDTLVYSAGRDVLYGGSGLDTLSLGAALTGVTVEMERYYARGDDGERSEIYEIENIIGSDFDDRIFGDANVNIITGGAGHDALYGGLGGDTLFGEDGDDIIYGDTASGIGGASDTLYGGNGDDALYGGDGDDVFYGGDGADKLFGGAGIDTIDYSTENAGVVVDLAGKNITYTDTGNDLLYDIENVIGTYFDDRILGNGVANTLIGELGNDRLFGWGGDDVIYGGDGNDIIYGDWKAIAVDDGADTIYAGDGDDFIIGGGGIDILHGGAGNDIYFWDAEDVYHGGAGHDVIYLGGHIAGAFDLSELSGSGIEQIALDNYKGYAAANTLTLNVSDLAGLANNNTISITGDALLDSVIVVDIDPIANLIGYTELNGILMEQFSVNGYTVNIQQGLLQDAIISDVIIGTEDADILLGTINDNIILGKAGDDIISGGLGNDRIDGGAGGDTIVGDEGDDVIIGAGGDDFLYGGAGNDIINATSGAWYDASWTHKQIISINADSLSSDLTDFTLRVSGDDFGDDFWNTVQADGRDILITDSAGTTLYATELVNFDVASRSMDLYVGVGHVSSENNTSYNVYYGNSTATLTTSSAWGDDYAGVWHLDDDYAASNVVGDSSSTGADGEALQNFSGIDEAIDGVVGQGLEFNNTEYVALNHAYQANTYIPQVSVTAWVNTSYQGTSYNQNWGILDYDRSEFFNVYVDGKTGQLAFSTNSDGNNGIDDMSAGAAINDGQWHHIAAVYDGADKILYVDGVEVGRVSDAHNGAGLGSDKTRYGVIGDGSESDSYNGGRNNLHFDGQLDELRLAETALTADEILAEFNNVNAPSDLYSVSTSADVYADGDDVDNLYGGDGDDTLYASSGADTLNGDGGNDLLYGGADANVLKGGAGDDTVYADALPSGVTDSSAAGFAQAVAAHSPDVYLRLNETSGSTVANTGNGGAAIDGIVNGGALLGAAALYDGGATSIQFDGVNDYISVPNSDLINTTSVAARTIELVFNADVTSGRHVLYEEGGGVNAISIYIDQGQLYFQAVDKNDFGPFDLSAAVNVGETYHAALVLDAASGTLQGFLNGALVGTEIITQALSSHSGAIGIGAQNGNTVYHDGAGRSGLSNFFEGRISDLAIHNNVVSAEDIAARYNTMQGDLAGEAGAIDDVLYGGDGLDHLYGGEGRDVFVFESDSAFNDVDEIHNFSISEFDSLDISDLLTNWINGDPVQGVINNFVALREVGADTIIAVDSDGAANGSNYTDVAQLNDVTGVTTDLLYNNDMLIVE